MRQIDEIERFFLVVRHWADHNEINDRQKLREEIYRHLPQETADETREELPEGEIFSKEIVIGNYKIGFASGQGIRNELEDTFAIEQFPLKTEHMHSLHLFCIFDGHGGKNCAQFAAEILPNILKSELAKIRSDNEIEWYNAIARSCIRVDEEWKNLPFQSAGLKDFSGTTAVVALLVDEKTLWTANVGDSGAVLEKAGKAIQLTESAKPTIPKYYKEILLRGGFVRYGRVDGSLDMARSIGDLSHPSVSARPTLTKVEITPDHHYLIIACDGLWDVIEPQTAIDSIKQKNALEASELLRTLAYQRGSTDNVSIIVVKLLS